MGGGGEARRRKVSFLSGDQCVHHVFLTHSHTYTHTRTHTHTHTHTPRCLSSCLSAVLSHALCLLSRRYYYLDRGQLYIGVWVAGAAKCGEMIDLNRQHAEDPTVYPIPAIALANPKEVLAAARREHLHEEQPEQ